MVAPAQRSDGGAQRVLVSVAVVAVVAVDTLYVAIVHGQGGGPSDEPLVSPFIAGYLATLTIGLGVSLILPGAVRAGLRGAASGGLLLMALLAGFSIGPAVLVGALLSIAALVVTVKRSSGARTVVAAIAGIVIGVAVLVVGLQLAWSHVVCPGSGQAGGTIPSLVGAGAAYQCSDGVLTVER